MGKDRIRESRTDDHDFRNMPIYEYTCRKCDKPFELLVRGSEAPACPSCGSRKVEKGFSVFGVGGRSLGPASREPAGPCGSCGDPRGAGACSLD
jgi:putative FmdB family regulatory protein